MADVVTLPQLGAGMTEGTFVNWLKNVGDPINKGEVIAEIESDKATIEVESSASGVITKTLVKAGDTVAVGAPIAEVSADGAGANGAKAPGTADKAPAPEAQASQVIPAAEPAGDKQVSKAAPSNGKSAPIPAATMTSTASLDEESPDGVKASPLARRMAEERKIDLRQVAGTGPNGRIIKSDVEGFQPSAAPTEPQQQQEAVRTSATSTPMPSMSAGPIPSGPGITTEPVTKIRSRIAARMVESKQTIPHFYLTLELDMGPALKMRKQINETLPEEEKVTVNDLVIKAVALTLRQYPNLNSHFYGDKVVRFGYINIGIAVALEKGGLINVVAKNADSVSISQLAKKNKEMIAAVRNGKVRPEDIEGSTFTVSNLGPYDIEHFMAIINPPEAGILAVGSAREVPVVVDGQITIANRMKVTLSVDHRISDGAEGAQFLKTFKELMETPMRLLL